LFFQFRSNPWLRFFFQLRVRRRVLQPAVP
jgi:hypothetical protein